MLKYSFKFKEQQCQLSLVENVEKIKNSKENVEKTN